MTEEKRDTQVMTFVLWMQGLKVKLDDDGDWGSRFEWRCWGLENDL